jgi:hypothetical protein
MSTLKWLATNSILKTWVFYSNEHAKYPDEIDITIVHKDFNEENKTIITSGTFIFLDNYLGNWTL